MGEFLYLHFLAEIVQNKDFYRVNDVRPPFTYASLIRQVGIAMSQQTELSILNY